MARITIKGLSSLQAKLKKLDPLTHDALVRGVGRAGVHVEGAAKHQLTINESVDTGLLRGSITSISEKTANGAKATVGTNVEYAPYVELGTSRSRAKPYMQPALQKNKKNINKIVATEVKNALKGL